MAYIKDAIYRELRDKWKEGKKKDVAFYIKEINRQIELFRRDVENILCISIDTKGM